MAQERDFLEEALQANSEAMQQLQQSIEEQQQHVDGGKAQRYEQEKAALQKELDDYIQESASVKDCLRTTKLENGELLQLIEDVRFESETLKKDLKDVPNWKRPH